MSAMTKDSHQQSKAKPFPTSPEPLTFTLQQFTDSLTPIRQTFKLPFIHEHAMAA